MISNCVRNELSHMVAFRVPTPKDCVPRCKLSADTNYYLCCEEIWWYKPPCEKMCKEKKSCCKI
ncbi:hypothetical protein Hanom_Chr16g01426921 [Helianthus anomalus]